MSAALELLSPADALSRLACILDCTKEAEAIRDTAVAEYIRACVYQPYFWEADWGAPRPIHTKRILSAVRRDVGFLWTDTDHPTFDSEISENDEGALRAANILRRLGNIGDIVELGGGFWAPGPVRIVWTADGQEGALLVVGGAPFEALEMKFATRISCVGCGRLVRPDRARLRRFRVEQELQSVDDWLGGPSENLSAWTRRTFKALVENMSPAADGATGSPFGSSALFQRDFGFVAQLLASRRYTIVQHILRYFEKMRGGPRFANWHWFRQMSDSDCCSGLSRCREFNAPCPSKSSTGSAALVFRSSCRTRKAGSLLLAGRPAQTKTDARMFLNFLLIWCLSLFRCWPDSMFAPQ